MLLSVYPILSAALYLLGNTYAIADTSPTPSTYTISLHNQTAMAFNMVFSELAGSTFDQTTSTLTPHSDLSLSLNTMSTPSAIIRFYQDDRPSFSLVLIGDNAYTSYCKDKPSAYQQGMYCKLAVEDNSIDLSILVEQAFSSWLALYSPQ